MGSILSGSTTSGNYTYEGYTTRISNDRRFVLTIERYNKQAGDEYLENINTIDNPKVINLLDHVYDINNNIEDTKLFDTKGKILITSSNSQFIYGIACMPT